MINGGTNPTSPWQPWPSEALTMARTALDLTKQDWSLTGQTTKTGTGGGYCHPTLSRLGNDVGVEEIVERMVALLLIRMVALVTCRLGNNAAAAAVGEEQHPRNRVLGRGGRRKMYDDYSTTTICRAALGLHGQQAEGHTNLVNSIQDDPLDPLAPPDFKRQTSDPLHNNNHGTSQYEDVHTDAKSPPCPLFPSVITPAVISQLRQYVGRICKGYSTPDTIPYHNVEHAYHVFLSANKLLDLMLCELPGENTEPRRLSGSAGYEGGVSGNAAAGWGAGTSTRRRGRRRGYNDAPNSSPREASERQRRPSVESPPRRPTFGIKSDPLSQLAFLFSALVHDVDHTGISNRQLVLEMDDLAILYNDQSVAEQRSLAVAFTTLKGGGYAELREVLFPQTTAEGGAATSTHEDFFKFRKLVIDLVLVTDIASPERTQIVKSKWKEAFGDVIVAEKLKRSHTVDKMMKKQSGRRGSAEDKGSNGRGRSEDRASNRRASFESVDSKGKRRGSSDGMGRYAPLHTSGTKKGMTAAASMASAAPPDLADVHEENSIDGNLDDVLNQQFRRDGSQGSNENLASSASSRRKVVREGSSGSISSSSRKRIARQGSQGSFTRGKNNSSATSQASAGSRPGRPVERPALRGSLVSTTDCESIRSAILDCDSIDFSDSSESSSSLVSEDDFDASAVSRQKMNFDSGATRYVDGKLGSSTSSFGSVGDGNISDPGGSPRRQMGPPPSSSSGASGSMNPRSRSRWSTGDLAEDDDEHSEPLGQGGHQQGSASVSNSFTTTPIAPRRGHHGRRKPSRRSRSQSMLALTELKLSLPSRGHSEERRLGVRRALDLAGSTVIAYSGSLRGSASSNEQGTLGDSALSGAGGGADGDLDALLDPDDDVDEFKATVVLEQMIRAADVAALLQDWDNSIKWATRLYRELMSGHLANRGEDPRNGWYENQIKFLDFYILPLAKNLGIMGVFEEEVGGMFATLVKGNMARWVEEGERTTEAMMKEDDEWRRRQGEKKERQQHQETAAVEDQMPRGGSPFNELRGGGGGIGTSQHSLNSSIKSTTSHNSCSASSATSAQNVSQGSDSMSGRRRRANSKKMINSHSLEVGGACIECGTVGRYSCPVCSAPYCSAKCCRDHKASGGCSS